MFECSHGETVETFHFHTRNQMKYTCKTEINLPISRVVELWRDENNLGKWQDGFIRIEHISGDPETVGAQSKIYLEQGKRRLLFLSP